MEIKSHKLDENKTFIKALKNIEYDGFAGSLILCTIFLIFGVYIEKCILDPLISVEFINLVNLILNFLEVVLLIYFIKYVINLFNKNKEYFISTLKIENYNSKTYSIDYKNGENLEDIIRKIEERIPSSLQKELYYICDSEISKLKIPILNYKIGYTTIIGTASFLLIHIMQIPLLILCILSIIIAFIFNYLTYKKEQYDKKKALLEECKIKH